MAHLVLAPAAASDIETILAWSHEHFGETARLRYEALLTQAIMDVADGPRRPGSHERPEIAPGVLTYHLRHSRDRVARSLGRVGRPRHFLLYREGAEDRVHIARVLHDSMDLPRYVPD